RRRRAWPRRKSARRSHSNDAERRHEDHRARRLSDDDVQVVDDLQPWFDAQAINAAVVPLGVRAEDFARAFPEIARFTNFHGALITMPHKVSVIALLGEVSTAVKVAGSCNAVMRTEDGRLVGDMFDGEGFVRGVAHNGGTVAGKRLLVVGCGGVGSAIAASA